MNRHSIFAFVAWTLISLISSSNVFAEGRSYTKYLLDEHESKILKLTVTYIGKKPKGEFEWHGIVDLRDRNLDFYTTEWTNLTSNNIYFIKRKSYSKIDKKKKEFRRLPDGSKEVVMVSSVTTRIFSERPRKYGNALRPYERQIENRFYGIAEDLDYNISFFETTFQNLNKEYILKYHFIGTR
jgi:hypothetical protein